MKITTISRRQAVKGLAIAGAGVLAAPALIRSSRATGRTIKVGFISPETGPLASFGSADTFILDGIRKTIGDGLDMVAPNIRSKSWCATASPTQVAPPKWPLS